MSNLKINDRNETKNLFTIIEGNEYELTESSKLIITKYHVLQPQLFCDYGLLTYIYNPLNTEDNQLELTFCFNAKYYSQDLHNQPNAQYPITFQFSKIPLFILYKFIFKPPYFQNLLPYINTNDRNFEMFTFTIPQSFNRKISLCDNKKDILQSLINHNFKGISKSFFLNIKVQELWLKTIECIDGEKSKTLTCKFLANQTDKDKIFKARDILSENIGNPITIKELSKKVAINECYLKKGFKELFGSTIFEYYQQKRMEYAKYLLYNKGHSVTEVSYILGYSSLSHFSTAFKRFTGIKACELLNHIRE